VVRVEMLYIPPAVLMIETVAVVVKQAILTAIPHLAVRMGNTTPRGAMAAEREAAREGFTTVYRCRRLPKMGLQVAAAADMVVQAPQGALVGRFPVS
jgi:hypothetical protein